jgi:polyketide biosynthesis enoyl-CoA hydratase PksH
MDVSARPAIVTAWSGPVLHVTLNRPDRGNPIDDAVLSGLHRALDETEARPDGRLMVIQAPGPAFSIGMDTARAAGPGGADPEAAGDDFFGLLLRFTQCPRVVLSCVDGRVAGGGVGLVAASDAVHSTERGVFSLPEAMWGLLPCSVLPFLLRRTGFQPASMMMLSTLPLTSARAEEYRLVDELSPDPGVLIRRLAHRLAKMDDELIGEAKRYLTALQPITPAARSTAVTTFARLAGSPPVQQRLSRFAETGRYPWE